MVQYIIIGIVIASLFIACMVTSRTARRAAVLLAKVSKEMVEVMKEVKIANDELTELRQELENEKKISADLIEKKEMSGRRKDGDRRCHDRREEDRRRNSRGRRADD